MEKVIYEVKPFLLASFAIYGIKGDYGLLAVFSGVLLLLFSGLIAWWRVQNRFLEA